MLKGLSWPSLAPARVGAPRSLSKPRVGRAALSAKGLAATVAAALVAGTLVVVAHPAIAFACLLLPFAIAAGMADWRRMTYALLIFLPFSGLPILAARASSGSSAAALASLLLKDALFVGPIYIGFAVHQIRMRRPLAFPAAPTLTLALLAVLVVGQMLNPSVPNALTALIGAKVWLLYMPMLFVGYHLLRDTKDLERLLKVMTLSALLPALLGLVEAVLFYTGHEHAVLNLYGQGAAAATQDFAGLAYGAEGRVLRRVPSTFTFFVQYFGFLLVISAVSWAWWRGFLYETGRRRLGAAMWALIVLAAFLSGSRNAYLAIPLVLALTIFLGRRALPRRRGVRLSALTAAATGAVLLGLGLLQTVFHLVTISLTGLLLPALDKVATGPLIGGLGTGTNTLAARITDASLLDTRVESWLLKGLVELGIVGLVLVVALLAQILSRTIRSHLRLRDHRLVVVSSALLALLLVLVLNTLKGFTLDLDPVNVYFWLLVGVMAKLPLLDQEPQAKVTPGLNQAKVGPGLNSAAQTQLSTDLDTASASVLAVPGRRETAGLERP